jgi:hypothetical protein
MQKLRRLPLSFDDIKTLGLFKTRATLKYLIDKKGFPLGHLIGLRTGRWFGDKIEERITNRPNDRAPLKGAAKASKEAKEANEAKEAKEAKQAKVEHEQQQQAQSPDTSPDTTDDCDDRNDHDRSQVTVAE